METKLMPPERLSEIVADAAVRAATDVTGIFRNERMTWTEQGIHAAVWNAMMHDEQVSVALKMVGADGAAEYEANRPVSLAVRPDGGLSVPVSTLMAIAGRSRNASVVFETLRAAWAEADVAEEDRERHLRAFDEAFVELRRQALLDARL